MKHYLEYGGGLGDVFNQLHIRNSYNLLANLKPEDRADVAIISHNPAVEELFLNHPKVSQMRITNYGYWLGSEDKQNRDHYGLPEPGALWRLPQQEGPVKFFGTANDVMQIASLPKPYVVVAASAGLPDRNIRPLMAERIIGLLLEQTEATVVLAGREYERHGRREWRKQDSAFRESTRVLDLVNQLTVGGTAKLLEGAAGLVTCHSALNILGWHLNVPQLLVYPVIVQPHLQRRDEWGFGAHRPNTVLLRDDDWEGLSPRTAAFSNVLRVF